MTIQGLLGRLHAADVRLRKSNGDLIVSGRREKVEPSLLDALRTHKAALLGMMGDEAGGWWRPPEIRPDAFALVDLDPEELDRIIARVPGGASNVQDIYPLAPLQEGILFHHLMDTEGDPYLLEGLLQFDSRARLDAYLAALRAVIARHDILRTAIAWEGLREPVQVVWREAPLKVEEVEVDAPGGDVEKQLYARFNPRHYRIDLREAPMLRVHIARHAAQERWLLLLLRHHIVSDHTTQALLRSEVKAYLSGRADELPPPVPFRNYVAQTRLGLSKEEHAAFFRECLADVTEPTAPFGLLDVWGDGSGIEEAMLPLEEELAARLRENARHLGVSAASLCHVAWAQVLARVSGREDVVFGTVLVGRMRGGQDTNYGMGMFINTLPVRVRVADVGAEASVRRTHRLLADLLRHEHASLALAQRCSGVKAPAPLFTSLLNYRHISSLTGARDAWAGIRKVNSEERTNYPLMLSVDDLGDGFRLQAQVQASIGPARVCALMHTALRALVKALETAPERALRSLDVLPAGERAQVVDTWNRTVAEYPETSCVHELFEAQAVRRPDGAAVVCGDRVLTYGELNARASQLAHRLRERGVGPDARVAICMQRSIELVVAELGVLKAGGAYVPIDPSMPAARTRFMVADSESRVLLSLACEEVPEIAGVERIHVDAVSGGATENPAVSLGSDASAYVMYTSGSTGEPKGVEVPHRAITRLVVNNGYAEFRADDRVAFAANPAFDATTMEVWAPLVNGGRVVVIEQDVLLDPRRFGDELRRQGVTALWLTVGLFNQYADALAERLGELRYLLVGGDALDADVIARVLRNARPTHLINGYGPTETTTFALTHEIEHVPEGARSIPLGRPIGNTRVYIVDDVGEPVPVGVAGELCIGGAGVARGYVDRPALTAERFIPDPFSGGAGGRLYRTGDLGRWLSDGTIEFLGRNDHQVKLRGFRVELGEIEARLSEHAGVRETAVLAREDAPGDKRLVAYWVGEETLGAEALRCHLSERLPEYMVPAVYVRLNELPLTPNGKVDRKSLPAPQADAYLTRSDEPPVGDTEVALAEIWSDLLDVERVGRHDHFFDLGGHSLLATRAISRVRQVMAVEVALGDVFKRPVLRDFAQALETAARADLPAIEPAARGGRLPLSFAQQRLWFLDRLGGADGAYHVSKRLRMTGELDREALRRALNRIVARHEGLRTTFLLVDGGPEQRILPAGEAGLQLLEHDLGEASDADGALLRLLKEDAEEPFDLERSPPIRGRLIRLGRDDHVLLLTMHHIVSDGWSMGVLVNELSALYGAFRRAEPDPLPPLEIQYADYVAWQRQTVAVEVLRAQADYWKQTLAGVPALLELPADRARPAQQDHAGTVVGLELDAALTAGLKSLSRRHGTTMFMTLLTGWVAVLSRLSGQTDVVVGTPVANRGRREIEGLIGFFVNTLALRLDLSGAPSVAELLRRVKARTIEAQHHQDIPFEQVVEVVQPVRSLAHSPLFQVMFAWNNTPEGELTLPGLQVVPAGNAPRRTAKFDLSLALSERGGRIVGSMTCATTLFERETAGRYAGYLRRVLEAMVADASQRVDRLPLLPATERTQVVEEWNATDATYPGESCLHELFETQVARSPDAVAVACGDRSLSYAELNTRANRLAHFLVERGVGPDMRVAICVERNSDMVAGLLAVLKAGGAFVPLDPSYPRPRLAYMLRDSAPVALLTQRSLRGTFQGTDVPVIALDTDAPAWGAHPETSPQRADLASDHLAYVIYTSGSTGQPKGVMIAHRGVANVVSAQTRAFGVTPESRILQFASFSFDACIFEVVMALCRGASLQLPDHGTLLAGAALITHVRDHQITHVTLPPALLATLPDDADLTPVQIMILAGDVVSAVVAKRWTARQHLINAYGPTEATIWASAHTCHGDEAGSPPIGRPIGNTRIYIVDDACEPVPVGVVGELYIGGAGVARGYVGRPALTAERFVADPFSGDAGARLYRTGDLGRWRSDGTIELLGRNDDQVKVRGFRIELGEIEATLSAHAGVREAVVVAREHAREDKRLVAYWVGAEDVDPDALRRHLTQVLPEYLVPAAYVRLPSLPLTPNGKVDRHALPAPEGDAYSTRAYEAPAGETETTLARIWSEVLRVERVGRHDHFFELGGHSLLAVTLIEQMRRQGLHATVRAVFTTPTLAALAAAVGRESHAVAVAPNRIPSGCEAITPEMLPLVALDQAEIDGIVAAVEGGASNVQDIYPLAPLQEGILFHHLMAEEGDPYLLSSLLSFESRARLGAYLGALQAVIARHDILRTAFRWEGLREPVQIVRREARLKVDEVQLEASRGDAAEQLRSRFSPRRCRIDVRDVPMRVCIAHDPAQERWLFLLLLHHLLGDHTTLEVLQSEVQAHLLGHAHALPEPLPFRNYVAQSRLGVSREEHETFFRELLRDVTETTAPFGLLDVRRDGSGIEEARLEVDAPLAVRLRARARRLGVSAATLCHVAWAQVLARVSGKQDVVFGTVLIGRTQGGEGADRVMGLFINTLPVRIRVGDAGAEASVRQTHALLAELLRYEHAPLALAQRCSGVEASTPLFSALLNYRHSGARRARAREARAACAGMKSVSVEERSNYPLTLSVDDLGDGFRLTAKVVAQVEAKRVCALMHRALETLVDAVETDPARALASLDVLPAGERAQVLEAWNATGAAYPDDKCVHDLFEAWAARTPDAVAVVHDGEQLTYAELNRRANQLAHHLRRRRVGPDVLVGICMERSPAMLVGLLGVLKAGGAYVPLDPAYPVERLRFMLRDSAPAAVLTQRSLRGLFATCEVPVLALDAEAPAWAREPAVAPERAGLTPDHLAYVIYTSGSTGQPKGVMTPHRCLVNRLAWGQAAWRLEAGAAVLGQTSLSFDGSVRELLWPLTAGARVVLARPEGHLDPAYLIATLRREQISTVNVVPSMLQVLLEQPAVEHCAGPTLVLCGGEALSSALVRRVRQRLPAVALHNLYGPSEAATATTTVVDGGGCETSPLVPIGRPIGNTRMYVLDDAGAPQPVGVAGELYIGGVGVARGYIGRPALTAARFVLDPFGGEPGGRLYRTGDLGRWRRDGTIEFLGRNDTQVKVRGFRIELGEIEVCLAQHAGVRAAVVMAREHVPGDRRLVAYWVGEDAVDVEMLRAHLSERLPEYMVPAAYVRLASLPLLPNGKLDRRALPDPDDEAYARRGDEAPIGETEVALAEIWSALLGVRRVGRWDHFFDLGGHSLLAVQAISRVRHVFNVDVALRELFASPTLGDFARVLERATQAELPSIERGARGERVPLSFAQQRLWFLDQMGSAGRAYHVFRRLRLKGALNRAALCRALDRIVARHEALRTSFVHVDGEPEQRVAAADSGFHLMEHDLSDAMDADEALVRLIAEESGASFDLEQGPLIRGRLVRTRPDEHVLLVTLHHIVSDAWSMGLLFNELSVLYGAYRRGDPDPLPALPVQYADYAMWQRRWMRDEALQAQAEYWKKTLAGAPDLLALPADRARPAEQEPSAAALRVALDEQLTAGLKALSRRRGTTLFMTLLAAWATVLSRLSGQEDVVIGSPTANRGRREIEGLIGFFVNTLALRLDLSGSPTVAELLARVKVRTLEAQQHQDIPFEQVVELVQPVRSLSHGPLFQVTFAWQSTPRSAPSLPGLEVTGVGLASHAEAKSDLLLSLAEANGRIVGGLEYATALFDGETVTRYLTYLRHVLEQMVADEWQRVDRLPLLPAEERAHVLDEWNRTDSEYPNESCVHELFEAQVERTPDAAAAVCTDRVVSYAELNARANRLAHHLRGLGVGPDFRVALCVERSAEMVVGLLGVLKAGGAYVPLDPSHPEDRLRYVLHDSAPAAILTQRSLAGRFAGIGVPVIALDTAAPEWADQPRANPERAGVTPRHLAYVIYTSGSTGRPKGVMVEHRGLTHYTWWATSQYVDTVPLRFALYSTVAFDLTVTAIYVPLLTGGTVVIYGEAEDDDVGILRVFEEDCVDAVKLTPSHLSLLRQHDVSPARIRKLIVGGEDLTTSLAHSIREAAAGELEIYNEYGPTEAVVGCMIHRFDPDADRRGSVSIGRPVANARVYILDESGEPVPVGVVGELYIGGVQVTRGYVGRPALTAARFIPDPFGREPGGRLYRTGDVGRWSSHGRIEFLGRNDAQVKVRGYRIELGEIEARLSEHPGVRQAVVWAREDTPGDKRLAAYWVGDGAIDAEALRSWLGERLPEYMVPSAYVHMEALPLTPNGKVDRRALPAPEGDAYVSRGYEAPIGEVEKTLAEMWSQLLGVERVGRHDHFFELGGHSLLALKLIQQMRRRGLHVGLTTLFTTPMLAALAAVAAVDAGIGSHEALVPPNRIPQPTSDSHDVEWLL